jgi:hypothetical protein
VIPIFGLSVLSAAPRLSGGADGFELGFDLRKLFS